MAIKRVTRLRASSVSADGAAGELRSVREALGLPRRQVAELLGCAPRQLRRWEEGASAPGPEDTRQIALVAGQLHQVAILAGAEQRGDRAASRLSQTAYAERIGVHRMTVSHWERAEFDRVLHALAEVFPGGGGPS